MEQPYFKNKNYWAIILGGSSGMGWATAQRLAAEGMNLCIVHRDRRQRLAEVQEGFEQLKKQGVTIISFNMDAVRTDKRTQIIKALKNELGDNQRIRLVLHAIAKGNLKQLAPIQEIKSALEKATDDREAIELYQKVADGMQQDFEGEKPLLKKQDFVLTIESMALSLYDWVRDLHQNELFAKDARIIGLTSEGSVKAWRGYAAVGAAKSVLESICRAIALEYAPYGIRCNVVQPGVTNTPSFRMIPGSDAIRMNTVLRNPFHRLTTPEDVAKVIYLLCRDEAAWINGAVIPVDGGERNG